MRALPPLARISFVALFVASCGAASSPGTGGSGGSSHTGGSTGTGGTATGGSTGTGGTATGTGGTQATGGVNGTGGSSTGGVTGTGGTGTGGSSTGGVAGTGGMGGHAGSGGTGGASATGGAAGGSATGGAGGAVIFSDDFESDTSGKQPAGFDNIISYNYKTTNPTGSQSAVADGTHAHGGKLAAHFVSDGSMVFLERPLPTGTNHLFVRGYFYFKNALGMQGSSDNHETLVAISMEPNDANNEVRFGVIKGVIGTNQVPSDNIAPIMAKWNGPPVITAATWHCIEVEFDGSAAYNTLNAWSDGTLVHSITQASDWQNGALPANWMNGMFNTFAVGWQSFSNLGNEIWVDDLVLSTARVGCN